DKLNNLFNTLVNIKNEINIDSNYFLSNTYDVDYALDEVELDLINKNGMTLESCHLLAEKNFQMILKQYSDVYEGIFVEEDNQPSLSDYTCWKIESKNNNKILLTSMPNNEEKIKFIHDKKF